MVKHMMAACMACVLLSACAGLKQAPVSSVPTETKAEAQPEVKPEAKAEAETKADPVADQLYAGTAKVDITPEWAVISAEGESFRLPDNLPTGDKIPPDNVNDSLEARVLVLKNKDVSLAVVAVDVSFFSSKRVVDEAKKQFGLDHVILSSTNTHSGMVPRGLCPTDGGYEWVLAPEDPGVTLDWPGLSQDPWYAATEEKVIAAIGEAVENQFPARIAGGQSPFESDYMAHNRRFVNPDGSVTMLWDNPNRIPTEPLDPTVRVVRVDDATGNPRAVVVHYACHPAILMGAGWISRDFPGAAVDYIEETMGESCMGMFLQGACGDLDPYGTSMRGQEALETMKKAGVSLGEAAVSVAEALPPSEPGASLRVQKNMVTVPYQTAEKSTQACVTTVVVGDELALVTIPGIPFVQLQLNLSEKSPVPNTLMLGLAYCGQGSPSLIYVPSLKAAKEGGHGASTCRFVSDDAGDRIVDAAVASINDLLAK